MVAKADVLAGLGTYLEEMERCAAASCNWALVHLLVMMPDVCAGLESEDGRTSEARYRAWCERWLGSAQLNGLERYKLRCSLLHQGQAQPDASRLKPGDIFRYDRISFGPAGTPHLLVQDRLLHVDVSALHRETELGIQRWAEDLEQTRNAFVGPNLRQVARQQTVEFRVPAGSAPSTGSPQAVVPGGSTAQQPTFVVVQRNVTN